MIDVKYFCEILINNGTDFFTGVPDSLLKQFCAYISDNLKEENHIIAANEGNAIGLACGFHLATGRIPLVYMQNSGIGNAVNPLLSLSDTEVYQIPILLLIGWRGEPDVKDEPQHIKQGKVTCQLMEAMNIPYTVMSKDSSELDNQLKNIYDHFKNNNSPFALIVKKDTFEEYKPVKNINVNEELFITREAAIEEIINSSLPDEYYFSTTGMASRELYEIRKKLNLSHSRDFLTVGSMGHASSIALGFALKKPELRVTCIDGDGALLMHMGSLAVNGNRKPCNFRHFVLNNGAHDSVGGQPTVGLLTDFVAIAKASGYEKTVSVKTIEELRLFLSQNDNKERRGPVLIEVRVCKGARSDLSRPKSTPLENKKLFMETLL